VYTLVPCEYKLESIYSIHFLGLIKSSQVYIEISLD